MIESKKKEGESVNSLLFRFNKRVKHSGVMKEMKKRRFKDRTVNKNKRRRTALYKVSKKEELKQARKYGDNAVSHRKNS